MPQIQALDLCIRITIGPVYFIPAPRFLIRFYRKHFQKFRGNASTRNDTSAAGRALGSSASESRIDHSVNRQSNAMVSKPAMASVATKGHAPVGGGGASRGMLVVYEREKYLEAGGVSSDLSGQAAISVANSRRNLDQDYGQESMSSRVSSEEGENEDDDSIDIRLQVTSERQPASKLVRPAPAARGGDATFTSAYDMQNKICQATPLFCLPFFFLWLLLCLLFIRSCWLSRLAHSFIDHSHLQETLLFQLKKKNRRGISLWDHLQPLYIHSNHPIHTSSWQQNLTPSRSSSIRSV